MDLILLKREFVTDLDEFTSQWREYLFNPNDPDGPILLNLVINSEAFELADAVLVWTNPATNDEYFYDSPAAVTKVAGTPPEPIPLPPDLTDPYGLRYVHEFDDANGDTVLFEIYKRNYEGAEEEVEASAENLQVRWENEGKVFVPFRGSRATVTLKSSVSRKFHEVFEGDERDHYARLVVNGTPMWTGWTTPDIFSEPWKNAPYLTTISFNDGIGSLKNLSFPDVNDNEFTGTISEKDAIIACLGRIGLRLNVNIACNLSEDTMDELSAPIEQSIVNVEAFVSFNQGERTAISCYAAMEKMLKSWNAVLIQEENEWWIVREPELYSEDLACKKFDADGTAITTFSRALRKTLSGEGIQLHGATLETKPAFTNVAVSQGYGELLVENGNFASNGSFENWIPYIKGGYQQGWKLKDWTYDKLEVFPFTNSTSLGRIRRVTESTGLDQKNNYINIYDVVRSFSDPVGRLISKPFAIKKEVGNRLQLKFKVRCNTYGSDNRLVEAYFNVALQVGTKWLDVNDTTGAYEWSDTETRIRWRVAEVMRWEEIVTDVMEIPADGDVTLYLYQIVQVGSVSKVVYVCDFDSVEVSMVDNPALQNERIYYKTANPEVYTSTLEELAIDLGDVATVMSQNAKIIDGNPSSSWSRAGLEDDLPLAHLICRELANQYQLTTYRLRGGRTNRIAAPMSFLATYEDSVNEEDRLFILTGGTWNVKDCTFNPDLVEINQLETTVEIRVVLEQKSGNDPNTGSNSGGGPDSTGSTDPTPPSVPVDLGDLDDVIPIIRDGRFEDSEIRAIRDDEEAITQYQFDKAVRGLPAQNDDEFVTKAQLPVIVQYGLLNGGTIQYRGDGLWFQWAAAVVGIGGVLNAPDDEIELAPSDPTLYREDLLGWLKTGPTTAIPYVIEGEFGGAFVPPPYDPTTFVVGISVKIPPAATVPDGTITTEHIYIDNAQWTVTKSGTGTLDADSTDNPSTGTKAVKSTSTGNGYRVRFTRSAVLDLSTLTDATLGMDTDLIAAMQNNMNLHAVFLDDTATPVSSQVTLTLNKASTAYQFLALDLTAFSFTSQSVKHLEIIFTRSGGGTFAGFYLDNVKIQAGVEQPVQSSVKHDSTTEKKGGDPVLGEWYHVTKNSAEGLEASGATAADPVAKMSDLPAAGISDAPSDGSHYARKDASWVAFTPLDHAPSDGNYYASRNGAWAAFTPFTVAGTPTAGHVVTSVAGVPTWAAPSGGGLSGLTTNKIPVATSATTIADSNITQNSTTNFIFGDTTSAVVATPLFVSFGGQFGNSTVGNSANLKWALFDNGTAADRYGIGMSNSLMEIRAGASGGIALFTNNGVERIRFASGGDITIGSNGGNIFIGNNALTFDNTNKIVSITGLNSGVQTPLVVSAGGTATRVRINHTSNTGIGLSIGNALKWSMACFNAGFDYTIYNDGRGRTNFFIYGATGNMMICDQASPPSDGGYRLEVIGNQRIQGSLTMLDAGNIIAGTTTGMKLLTATAQKLGVWNATPIIQPTTAFAAGTLVSNGGTPLTSTDTIDGYTLLQLMRMFRMIGFAA